MAVSQGDGVGCGEDGIEGGRGKALWTWKQSTYPREPIFEASV